MWDFSGLELTDQSHVIDYSEVAGLAGIIAGTERCTRYYYRQAADSLLLTGYENNTMRVVMDRPELLLCTPLAYGSHHEGVLHGTVAYCEKVFLRMYGSYQVEVDGTGMMVLPSGDTLRHVSRIHSRTLTATQHYPHIMTERALAAYVDSVRPYTDDSIRCHLTTDTLLTERDTYRWYAAGYRYPILEAVAANFKAQAPQYAVAYYCAPEEQLLQDDEENRLLRETLAQADQTGGANGDGADGGSKMPLTHVTVQTHGQTVTVSYGLAQDATVTGLVCDMSGIVYRQQSQSGHVGDACRMDILCAGLHSGQYVLYLNACGQVLSRSISL